MSDGSSLTRRLFCGFEAGTRNLKRRPVALAPPAVIEVVGKKPGQKRGVRLGVIFSTIVALVGVCGAAAAAQNVNPTPVPAPAVSATPNKDARASEETKPTLTKTPAPSVVKPAASSAAKPVAPSVAKPAVSSVGAKPQAAAVTPKTTVVAPAKLQPAAVPKVQPQAPVATKPVVDPVVTPTPALAPATQSNTEQSKLVYDQAVAAYEEHRYRDAIDLFQQADILRPNPAFSFNIGTAYEDMGDSAMALLHYRAYLRKLPKAFDREDVENRVRRLEGVLADKGLQQVTIISNPSEAMVILDGKPRGVSPWTGEVAPGAHVVTLSLQGYADETRDFDLPSRRSIDVPVSLKKPEPKPAVPVIDLNQKRELEPKASWEHIRPVTWGVLGVSVASFGAALGFELSRSALEERSQQADSAVGRTKFHEDAQRSEMWAKSFLMFALGMGATSIVLGYQNIDDGLQAESERQEKVSFGCVSMRECGVTIQGSF